MVDADATLDLRPEHSGDFLRLQRLLEGRRSFTLCFLIYSDSFYRDRVASFLEERLGVKVRVSIDRDTSIGTEDLFERLNAAPLGAPSQLMGLEHRYEDVDKHEGIDNLLTRLNYRREALAERCTRPLLFWVLSKDLNNITIKAADLWAWRSGVFDFSLPPDTSPRLLHRRSIDWWVAPRRRDRLEELKQYLAARPSLRSIDADLLLEQGDLQRYLGDSMEAERAYLRAEAVFSYMDDQRRRAITRGRIADLCEDRGQLDEALHIRAEEQLPVFEKLGDERSIAITRGRIADIRQTLGQLDEALRIRTEEELPVYEKLGDERSIAITRGRIAHIHQIRGQLDEALHIRIEEELPVYEKLGDERSIAITRGWIADILETRGQLDEALRIRTGEQLPVFEKFEDERSIAIIQGRIAHIHQIRGQLDEALRIRIEEQLPVFEKLGDRRSIAITRGDIADIQEAYGQVAADIQEAYRHVAEALRIYERDVLPDITESKDRMQIEHVCKRIASLRESLRELSKGSLGR